MNHFIEPLIQRIKENSKCYYGHEVNVITFYNSDSSYTAVIISAQASASEDSANNDIHISLSSSQSFYRVIANLEWELGIRIGKKARIDGDGKTLHIDRSIAPCNCPHVQSPPVATNQDDKIRVLEARLHSMEKQLLDATAPSGDGGVPGGLSSLSVLQKIDSKLEAIEPELRRNATGGASSLRVLQKIESKLGAIEQQLHSDVSGGVSSLSVLQKIDSKLEAIEPELRRDVSGGASRLSVLQTIESKLEAIEKQLHRDVGDRTHATCGNDGSIHGVTNIADIPDDQPNPIAHGGLTSEIPDPQLDAQHTRPGPGAALGSPPGPGDALRSPPGSGAVLESPPGSRAALGLPPGSPTLSSPPAPVAAPESPPSSPTLSSQYGVNIEDLYSVTDMTPSASVTERSSTPRVGPDETAEINREVIREEIGRALAGAMFSLASEILERQGGGGGN